MDSEPELSFVILPKGILLVEQKQVLPFFGSKLQTEGIFSAAEERIRP